MARPAAEVEDATGAGTPLGIGTTGVAGNGATRDAAAARGGSSRLSRRQRGGAGSCPDQPPMGLVRDVGVELAELRGRRGAAAGTTGSTAAATANATGATKEGR